MNPKSYYPTGKLLVATAAACLTTAATAQDIGDIEEIVVVGSRGEGRDPLESMVPVDVISASDMQQVATLGGELEVPTLNGRVKLKIPAETQSGKLFRLRGKGVRSVRSGYQGDLLCRVHVETPVNLTKKQKELLEQLSQSLSDDKVEHSPRSANWLDGVKKFFEDMKF